MAARQYTYLVNPFNLLAGAPSSADPVASVDAPVPPPAEQHPPADVRSVQSGSMFRPATSAVAKAQWAAHVASVAARTVTDTMEEDEDAEAQGGADFVETVLIIGTAKSRAFESAEERHRRAEKAAAAPALPPSAAAAALWDARVVLPDGSLDVHEVALFSTHLPRYAGVYAGAVFRVAGLVVNRTPEGRVLQVALRTLTAPLLPAPACLPAADPALTDSVGRSLRVHLVAGPFGADPAATVGGLCSTAGSRRASTLVLTGPFLPPPTEQSGSVNIAFTDLLRAASAAAAAHRVRLVLVPSLGDLHIIPALPQQPFVFETGDDNVITASNPCELRFGPLRIGVCSRDVLSLLAEAQLEHGTIPEQHVRQLCVAALRSGLYSPVVFGADSRVDMGNVAQLAFMDGAAPHLSWTPNALFSTPVAVTAAASAVVASTPVGQPQRWTACELTFSDVGAACRDGVRNMTTIRTVVTEATAV